MIRVVKFKAEHAALIVEQDKTKALGSYFKNAHHEALEKLAYSHSVFDGEELLMCGGIIEYWPGRGEVWAILAGNIKHRFVAIHKAVLKFIKETPIRRLEATVHHKFSEGHRWVEMLGFKLEAPLLKSYMPDGVDASLYALVRGQNG